MTRDTTTVLVQKRDLARIERIRKDKGLVAKDYVVGLLLDHYEATAGAADA